jgi:hypothetical protein
MKRRLVLLSPFLVLGAIVSLDANPPAWWSARGVIALNPATHQPLAANDYAAANQGQLKWIANQAAQELNASCPGGSGTAIPALVSSWSAPTSATSDYSPVTLGQLKFVAQPFYDRLILLGYASGYPWSGTASDHAMANLGQVKNVFSFDVAKFVSRIDGSGAPVSDWWQIQFFGTNFLNLPNTGAYQYYNGNTIPNYEIANPLNPSAGILTISITTPSGGSTF